MITAVDTSVLVDILIGDKQFGQSSSFALRRCLDKGAGVICGVVVVETVPLFPSADHFLAISTTLNLRPATISLDAFFQAAKIWKIYKQHGGKRTRVVADFIIGAHALVECDQLLTRDRGFYREYFKDLKIIEP